MKLSSKIFFLCCLSLTNFAFAELRVGFLIPLSGPFAEAGEQCRRGIEVARSVASNVDSIKIFYGDTQFKASTALVEFRKLTEVNKVATIMSLGSTLSLPLAEPANKIKLPMIFIAGHGEILKVSNSSIRAFPSSQQLAQILIERFDSSKSLSIITSEDEWLLSIATHLNKLNIKKNIKIVEDIKVDTEQSDLRTLVYKVAKAEQIYLNLFPAQLINFVKQLRSSNYQGKIFANYYVQQDDVVSALGANTLEGVEFIDVNVQKSVFQEAFKKVSPQHTATGATYTCYAAASVMFQAALDTESLEKDSLEVQKERLSKYFTHNETLRLADESLGIIEREIYFDLQHFVFKAGKPEIQKSEKILCCS